MIARIGRSNSSYVKSQSIIHTLEQLDAKYNCLGMMNLVVEDFWKILSFGYKLMSSTHYSYLIGPINKNKLINKETI